MSQPEIQFRVVCMDCTCVLQKGDDGAPVSHGLCLRCFGIRMEAIDASDRSRLSAKTA